jgi:hypothetical protein
MQLNQPLAHKAVPLPNHRGNVTDAPGPKKQQHLPLTWCPDHNPMEANMAKGDQRNEKMAKKPKKDTSAPKAPVSSDRPMAPMTSVLPKGKLKNKPGA